MARIFYSCAGEGRGHAARVRTVVEELRREHEVAVFAPGDAWRLLAPTWAPEEVRVRRIPGLCFAYDGRGRVDVLRTGLGSLGYVRRLRDLVAHLRARIERARPDLVITDFEPALPRAAAELGVPFVSLSHQHFLVASDLSALPARLRLHASFMGGVVRAYYSGQAATIVSSFYAPPLKAGWEHVEQIGVLLRPQVRAATATRAGHLVAYFRRGAPTGALRALMRCGRPVKVYGLGYEGRRRDLDFRPISEQGFLADLASCDAVVSTAGNQLVGEAFHLGKPVLAIAEDGNHEQEINAFFVRRSGAGEASAQSGRLEAGELGAFLERLPAFRAALASMQVDGTPAALAALRAHLPTTRAAARTPAPAVALAS